MCGGTRGRGFGFGLGTGVLRLRFGIAHVAAISPEGEDEEEAAEDVLAFGNPGDGFDVERVPGEEGGDHGAAPLRAGQLPKDEKEQDGIGGVNKEIGAVMGAGIETVEGAVCGVGKPGEGMPVAGVAGGEGPGNGVARDAMLDGKVQQDVIGIVVVDEVEMGRGPVNGEGDEGKEQTEECCALFFGHDGKVKDWEGGCNVTREKATLGKKCSK